MDVKITHKTKNHSLQREEITFTAKAEKATPKRVELREKIAALHGAKPEAVIIGKIETRFGAHEISGTAIIYENPELVQKTELLHLIEKSAGIKRVKKEKTKEAPKKEAKK
ncbi:MAG TPA: 30S ribosomal protein S24e [archaeon]|nr:30S ribosomal protein S24e [archaeon]